MVPNRKSAGAQRREINLSDLTPEEETLLKKEYEVISNPVLWAETYLCNPEDPTKPLRLRDFQKDVLLDKSKKKVIRWGRRLGKTVSMCVDMLWKCMTNANTQCLVVCPLENHIEIIWNTLTVLVRYSPEVQSSTVRFVKKPFWLEFRNGSTINGQTAGAKTDKDAIGVRGKSADHLYLDETDYLGGKAVSVTMAIYATRAATTLWASSTPSGRREQFYNWCTDKKIGFSEHHHPTWNSPVWNKEMEMTCRAGCETEMDWIHDYAAEFGEQVEGVFPLEHLEFCVDSYKYSDMLYDPNSVYLVGIDWNREKTGNQIIVLQYFPPPTVRRPGYEPHPWENKLCLFARYNISVKDSTGEETIKKIVEINDQLQPAAIYCDRGFGDFFVEKLQRIGKENPSSRLLERLKAIDFSQNTIIKAPKGEDIKWNNKRFMVANAVGLVSHHRVLIPVCEDQDNKLIWQIRRYKVERRNTKSEPIYTKDNDHILVAWMLALMSFTIEFEDRGLIKPVFTSKITQAPITSYSRVIANRWDVPTDKEVHVAPQRQPMFQQAVGAAGLPYHFAKNKQESFDREDELYLGKQVIITPLFSRKARRRKHARSNVGGRRKNIGNEFPKRRGF